MVFDCDVDDSAVNILKNSYSFTCIYVCVFVRSSARNLSTVKVSLLVVSVVGAPYVFYSRALSAQLLCVYV